jgi:hypothetical protein
MAQGRDGTSSSEIESPTDAVGVGQDIADFQKSQNLSTLCPA